MGFPVFGSLFQKLLILLPLTSDTFNYDNPNEWSREYPQCSGSRQSPIAIYNHKTIRVNLPPLIFGYYDEYFATTLELQNKGTTAEFAVPTTIVGEKPFITGGLLTEVYEAEAVHFHWGSALRKGSEHVINGRPYDIEMHIVHKNVNYDTLAEARQHPDGIAVLGVLFKAVKFSNVYYPALNEIYNTLKDIVHFNSTSNTQNLITLDSLLGDISTDDFYTYTGSLTTPPCSEAVTWTVFSDVLPISNTVLPKFWQLIDKRGLNIKNNFRPIQPIKDRNVYHRKPFF